jgi:hypothetical protein
MKEFLNCYAENKNPWVEMHFGELGWALMGKKFRMSGIREYCENRKLDEYSNN